MPLPPDEAWFPAKQYGYGWGWPRRMPGWITLLIFLGGLAAATPLARVHADDFIEVAAGLCALLVAVCWWKGERPRWRWGGTKKPTKKTTDREK